jgi:sensor c-di-GMP phosphodiesterase-like protein
VAHVWLHATATFAGGLQWLEIAAMARSNRLVTVTRRELFDGWHTATTEGCARAALFNASMSTGGHLNLDLGADLCHAIDRSELRIVYQPIISLSDTSVGGFEALVRWQHARRGVLQPLEFIPTAEKSDLIVAIDRWMIREAALQLVRWRPGGMSDHVQMSVNVSSGEFSRDDFIDDVRRILVS